MSVREDYLLELCRSSPGQQTNAACLLRMIKDAMVSVFQDPASRKSLTRRRHILSNRNERMILVGAGLDEMQCLLR